MPKVNVIDQKGNMLQMQYLDEFFFPFFPFDTDASQHIRDIQNLEIRPDDILIWSYAKCGNHWLWEMIRMLHRGHVDYDQRTKEAHTTDFMTPDMLKELPSPRPLNSHFLHRHLPRQIFEKKTKTIILHRDPKDVAVSWYHHMIGTEGLFPYNGDFPDFLDLYLEGTVPYGSWFNFERSVLQSIKEHPDLPVHHMFYEDMKEDCARELRKMVKFLGMTASDELCQQVADACEFKKLKAVIADRPDPLRLTWKEGTEGMCRKGIVGDWKNWFSEEDKERLDKVLASKLGGTFLADRYLK